MSKLVWLHLSDIHFLPNNEWRDSTARNDLLKFLKTELDKHKLKVDLIFCTGDIAFGEMRSQPLIDQYSMAKEFFNQVLDLCKCDITRLFVVPGNHDIDRGSITNAVKETWTRWGSDDKAYGKASEITAGFAKLDSDTVDVMRRLKDWGQFVANYLPHQIPATKGHHHYAQILDINGRKIGIAGLNSAWTCAGDDDDRRLWLAEAPQFDHMRSQLESADLKIGLIHHPCDWFNVAERSTIKTRIQVEADFWLHGHTHDAWVEPTPTHITLGAGAITANSETEFGCNLVQLDFEKGKGQAHLYRFQKRRAQWIVSTDAVDDGIWSFDLPKKKGASNSTSVISSQTNLPKLRSNPPLPGRPMCLFREKQLQVLARALLEAVPQPVLLHGYGGMGKTEIATRFLCSDEAVTHFGSSRYFLNVESLENTPLNQVAQRLFDAVAQMLLHSPVTPDITGEILYEALRSALSQSNTPVLLVLDNYETLFQIDPHLASATIDKLASLAHQGLSLVVTLRAPLPSPRSDCVNLQVLPFKDDREARSLLLKWAKLDETILSLADEQALQQLLGLAEGYPIQLQMLGVLASYEGLTALALRCKDVSALAAVTDTHEENDRHRHPNLSFALTWNAPRLTNEARTFLRAFALLPDGATENWFDKCPHQDAVRNLRAHKLLWSKNGRKGEVRVCLITPFRQYLLRHHKSTSDDMQMLVTTWADWLKDSLPELFDKNLVRKSAAWYGDFHANELAAINAIGALPYLNPAKALDFRNALRSLENLCGGVINWPDQVRVISQAVINSLMFETTNEAIFFAKLLVGSNSLSPALKNNVAEAFRQRSLDKQRIELLKQTFLSEITTWAWIHDSFDLALDVSDILGEGVVCLHASVEKMLEDIAQIQNLNVQIILLDLARAMPHINESEYAVISRRFSSVCNTQPNNILGRLANVRAGDSRDVLSDLKEVILIAPNHAYVWSILACNLPQQSIKSKQAWEKTLVNTERFLADAKLRNFPVDSTVLKTYHDAILNVRGAEDALPVLRDWASSAESNIVHIEAVDLLLRFIQAEVFDKAAYWFLVCARNCNSFEEAKELLVYARVIEKKNPIKVIEALYILNARFQKPDFLAMTAILLLGLDLQEPVIEIVQTIECESLEAGIQNNLAYTFLTRGDETTQTLELACKLVSLSFETKRDAAVAETLLCAALRCPSSIPVVKITKAFQYLVTQNPEDAEFNQLAGLYFDAKRYDALPLLRRWHDECELVEQESLGWQALDCLLNNIEPNSIVKPVYDKLVNECIKIETQLREESELRTKFIEEYFKREENLDEL